MLGEVSNKKWPTSPDYKQAAQDNAKQTAENYCRAWAVGALDGKRLVAILRRWPSRTASHGRANVQAEHLHIAFGPSSDAVFSFRRPRRCPSPLRFETTSIITTDLEFLVKCHQLCVLGHLLVSHQRIVSSQGRHHSTRVHSQINNRTP